MVPTLHPPSVEGTAQEAIGNEPGHVIATYRPVQAGTDGGMVPGRRLHLDTGADEPGRPVSGESPARIDDTQSEPLVTEGNAQLAGKMAVTAAPGDQLGVGTLAPQGLVRRAVFGERGQRLHGGCDPAVAELDVTMAALPPLGEQLGADQPVEMLADRAGGHVDALAELAGGPGSPVQQRGHDQGTAVIGQDLGDAGQIGAASTVGCQSSSGTALAVTAHAFD